MTIKMGEIANRSAGGDLKRSQSSGEVTNVLQVSSDKLVWDLLEECDISEINAVMVTDEEGDLQGMVYPKWIMKQIADTLGGQPKNFREAMVILDRHTTEKGLMSHEHEWLNFDRPSLWVCTRQYHITESDWCGAHNCPCMPY